MSGVKVYRLHNCTRSHRSWITLAKCVWPKVAWGIIGDGPYATVSRCSRSEDGWRKPHTVHLHMTLEQAHAAIADLICGGQCRGQHEIVKLERQTPAGSLVASMD